MTKRKTKADKPLSIRNVQKMIAAIRELTEKQERSAVATDLALRAEAEKPGRSESE